MTLQEQGRAFLVMALCGALLGTAYDMLGVLRRGKLLTAAADLAFGPLAALGVIAAALYLRCEAFRLYTLLGVAVGLTIYFCSIGTFVRFIGAKMKNMSNYLKKVSKISGTRQENEGKTRITKR